VILKKVRDCATFVERKKACIAGFKSCNAVHATCNKNCASAKNKFGCLYDCSRDKQDCKREAREKLSCPKSSFQARCSDDCRLSSDCRKTCKINPRGQSVQICSWNCLNSCRKTCERKARVILGRVSLHRRCERYLAKSRYIAYLQSRVDLKKKQSKKPNARHTKFDSVLASKRRRVQVFLNKYKCLSVKPNPFCSKVKVHVKCKNAPDAHGKKMREINGEIAKLTTQMKNSCKKVKKAAPKVVVVPKSPAVNKPATPVKAPVVPKNVCADLPKLKAQIKQLYEQRTTMAKSLATLIQQGPPKTKEASLARDKVSQQVNALRDQLVVLLRNARNAQLACKK